MIYKSKLEYSVDTIEAPFTDWLDMLGLRDKIKDKTGVHNFTVVIIGMNATSHGVGQHAGTQGQV